jgi:hypothetical protein
MEKKTKELSFTRDNAVQQPLFGGDIVLAGTEEKDPMKAKLVADGYKIVSENDFGVIATRNGSKPMFLAKTKDGFMPGDAKVSLFIPEALYTQMRIFFAKDKTTLTQGLTQAIMEYLTKRGIGY